MNSLLPNATPFTRAGSGLNEIEEARQQSVTYTFPGSFEVYPRNFRKSQKRRSKITAADSKRLAATCASGVASGRQAQRESPAHRSYLNHRGLWRPHMVAKSEVSSVRSCSATRDAGLAVIFGNNAAVNW